MPDGLFISCCRKLLILGCFLFWGQILVKKKFFREKTAPLGLLEDYDAAT